MSDAVYGCDTCRTTTGRAGCPTHRDPPPGAAMVAALTHRHVWRYDGQDGPYFVYHCDDHDPPIVRTVWHTNTSPEATDD